MTITLMVVMICVSKIKELCNYVMFGVNRRIRAVAVCSVGDSR